MGTVSGEQGERVRVEVGVTVPVVDLHRLYGIRGMGRTKDDSETVTVSKVPLESAPESGADDRPPVMVTMLG